MELRAHNQTNSIDRMDAMGEIEGIEFFKTEGTQSETFRPSNGCNGRNCRDQIHQIPGHPISKNSSMEWIQWEKFKGSNSSIPRAPYQKNIIDRRDPMGEVEGIEFIKTFMDQMDPMGKLKGSNSSKISCIKWMQWEN